MRYYKPCVLRTYNGHAAYVHALYGRNDTGHIFLMCGAGMAMPLETIAEEVKTEVTCPRCLLVIDTDKRFCEKRRRDNRKQVLAHLVTLTNQELIDYFEGVFRGNNKFWNNEEEEDIVKDYLLHRLRLLEKKAGQ